MTPVDESKLEKARLLPHQERFIEQFFASPTQRGFVLRSDPGLGASVATLHLIRRVIQNSPDARVIVLSPKALGMQIYSQLRELGVSAELVDRFRYRELQETTIAEGPLWPRGAVSILSMQFATQKDVAESLIGVPWTLLIVSEAHLFSGRKVELGREIVSSSPDLRMVLIAGTSEDTIPTLMNEPLTTIRWRTSEIVDHAGQPLFVQMPTELEFIEFKENEAEERMHLMLQEIIEILKRLDRSGSLLGSMLMQSLASSPAALEDMLRGLRNRLAHRQSKVATSDCDEEDDKVDELMSNQLQETPELLAALNKCLDQLDLLKVDSKLEAFANSLKRISPDIGGPMCVVTDYRATLFYLQIELEDMGLKPNIFHGTMSYAERSQAVDEFKQNNGILLVTSAGMEGLSLPEVQLLFLYDCPKDPRMVEQVYGRFRRFGRRAPLKVKMFSDPRTSEVFSVLRDKLQRLCDQEKRS